MLDRFSCCSPRHGVRAMLIGVLATVFCCALCFCPHAAWGEEVSEGETLVITGGTVHTLAGAPITDGVIVVRDGRIVEIGTDTEVAIGSAARRVDARGWTVIPGLVDAGTRFVLGEGDNQSFRAHHQLADALDVRHPLVPLVRQEGITTVGVLAESDGPVGGVATIVKLVPEQGDGASASGSFRTVRRDAYLLLALCGLTSQGRFSETSGRLEAFYELRDQLRAAQKYSKTWEKYREAVGKYNEQVRKYNEKLEADKKPATEKKSADKNDKPSGEKGKQPPEKKDAPKAADGGLESLATFGQKDGDKAKAKPAAKPAPKKPKPPRAPKKPKFDVDLEILVKLLAGKLPIWIAAHRSDEIAYALRLKKEFDLDITLIGMTEGYARARALAEAKVPAVVGPVLLRRRGLCFLNHRESNLADLSNAGVDVSIAGFDSQGLAARQLRLHAAVAVRGGLDRDQALRAITLEPARRLGIADRVGSLEVGKDADMVILDGDPLSATTSVLKVIIDGKIVYSNEKLF